MDPSILVVDDDTTIAAILAEFLTAEGYRVRCAYDGEAALREIERTPPDLVVSDVSMPRLDGVTMMKQLRARGLRIPVVLVSAEVYEVRVPEVTFLTKPVDLDDFGRLIGQILAESA
jgi:DNA-binding response OmpR family regulator